MTHCRDPAAGLILPVMALASNQQAMVREALLALVVLALAFLNFGHESAVLAANGRIVVTAHSVCGDPGTLPAAGDHFACHGCKPDLTALPPVSPVALRVSFCAQTVAYAPPAALEPAAPGFGRVVARGPPAA
jgi:hypothetical protein